MNAAAAFGVVHAAIAAGPIPGAAACVGLADGSRHTACVGALEPGGESVTPQTWYDLASLTKVISTTSLCLELVAEGRLDPAAPLRELLPEAGWLSPSPGLAEATVLELAAHTSGLPAWEPLYTLGLDRATLQARLLQTPLTPSRGSVVYSDLGFIVLGHLLERLTGLPLQELASALFARLGLEEQLGYGPPSAPVAPTERDPWRGRVLRGEVHDENAAALGGVAGHAGLFGTLEGVSGFARAMLQGRVLSPAVLDYLSREHGRAAAPSVERRGFGWALAAPGWSGGDLCSPRTIGHTGFAGCGLWLDLDRGTYTVLLTNRVHPSRHTESGIARLRRAFNHAAAAAGRLP